MTPRYVPPPGASAAELDLEVDYIRTSARHAREERERAEAKVVREASPYRPDAPERERRSWFRDFMVVTLAAQRRDRSQWQRSERASSLGDLLHDPSIEEASARLRGEQRSVTTTSTSGGSFVPKGPPAYVADAFATAARGRATLAGALRTEPLPDTGLEVDIPVIATPVTVGVQATETNTVSNQDFTSSLTSSPVGTIAGYSDVTRQWFDRASPAGDAVLARELGAAIGSQLDRQIIAGAGSSGQLLGLASTTGILTASFASGTAQALAQKLWAGYQACADPATGFGVPSPSDYITITHPRVVAWLMAEGGITAEMAIGDLRLPPLVPSSGIRTTLGAGTNEAEAYVLAKQETPLYLGPVQINVNESTIGNVLGVRVTAYQFAAMHALRAPKAVCRISGAGFAAGNTAL